MEPGAQEDVAPPVSTPVPLDTEQESPEAERPETLEAGAVMSGSIQGSAAGAFDYYEIESAGDDRDATIIVSFTPANPTTAGRFGFNVYGPGGTLIGEGTRASTSPIGEKRLTAAQATPDTWLIQVYNYWPNQFVSYEIRVEGLE
jgi:hypothetical protein